MKIFAGNTVRIWDSYISKYSINTGKNISHIIAIVFNVNQYLMDIDVSVEGFLLQMTYSRNINSIVQPL